MAETFTFRVVHRPRFPCHTCGGMRKTDEVEQERPAICVALSHAVHEAGWTSRELARALGVDDSVVSRWRSGQNIPDRDSVRTVEEIMGLPIGYISQLAGYVAEGPDADDLLAILRRTPLLTEAFRKTVLPMVEAALHGSEQERRRLDRTEAKKRKLKSVK